MGNEVYTDLENAIAKEKLETIRMRVIELLVNEYIDDAELGKAVRDYVSIEKGISDD